VPEVSPEVLQLVRSWRRALCLSNDESDLLRDILDCVQLLHQPAAWSAANIARQKRLTHRPGFGAAAALIGGESPALAVSVESRLSQLRATPSGLRPEPLVNGDDLVAAGFKPGRLFKQVLDGVYDAQLEDRVATQPAAMDLAQELALREASGGARGGVQGAQRGGQGQNPHRK
jgi:poly(A) polymerase